jgi:hypothetical protein
MGQSCALRAGSLADRLAMGVEPPPGTGSSASSRSGAHRLSFAPALLSAPDQEARSPSSAQGYGPAAVALPWKRGRFSGRDFALQPDGTLRCPAGQSLVTHERRREADGSLRVVYAASIRSCRPCPLREQCLLKIAVQRVKKASLPRSLSAVFPCLCCFLSKSYVTGCTGDIT